MASVFVASLSEGDTVGLQFPGSATEPPEIAWALSRDLLWEGLRRPAGLGDVHISPPCRAHGRRLLRIRLRGKEGIALLEVPFRALRTWLLRHSFTLVRAGTESSLIDWDGALARLCSGP